MNTKISSRLFKSGIVELSIYNTKERIGKLLLMDYKEPGAYISHLSIKDKYQSNGYGNLLMKEALKRVASRGVEGISLHVDMDNIGAIRFYKRLGFFIAVTTTPKDKGIKKHYLMAKQIN